MINWMHFPKNKPLDEVSAQIVKAFESVEDDIDSYSHQLKSDEVLIAPRRGWKLLDLLLKKAKKAMILLLFRCCMV